MSASVIFCRLILGLLIAAPATLLAQEITNITFNNLNLAIPDNNPYGVQNSQTISGISGTISNLQVSLTIAGTGDGAYNGDLYAELINGAGGFVVLLNRVGISSTNVFSYGDNGFSVTFSDQAAHDIHWYQNYTYSLNPNGQLTGTWQPDGENINPMSNPIDFDYAMQNQAAMLISFVGDNPDDTWTLFVADLSAGGTAQISSWSLDITTSAEPGEMSLLAAGLILICWLRRWRGKT